MVVTSGQSAGHPQLVTLNRDVSRRGPYYFQTRCWNDAGISPWSLSCKTAGEVSVMVCPCLWYLLTIQLWTPKPQQWRLGAGEQTYSSWQLLIDDRRFIFRPWCRGLWIKVTYHTLEADQQNPIPMLSVHVWGAVHQKVGSLCAKNSFNDVVWLSPSGLDLGSVGSTLGISSRAQFSRWPRWWVVYNSDGFSAHYDVDQHGYGSIPWYLGSPIIHQLVFQLSLLEILCPKCWLLLTQARHMAVP